MDLSFSGAGFMGCYYFGVVNCWDKYIPRERVRRVAGASAGSLIAAYYLMELPLEDCLKEIIELTERARSLPLGVFDRSNQVVDVLPQALDKMFPEDAHKRVNGRLYVAMTRLKDFKSVVVNEFETRQDLIDALNCSCFIPLWSGNHVSTYKGVKYIDGGFTNNLPVFDEHTIRVSCFAGASDISPYDQARMEMLRNAGNLNGLLFDWSWKNLRRCYRALWPPPPSFIAELLRMGYHDTKEFILSNDLIQCGRCFRATARELQPIYSQLTPTISPAVSPAISRASSMTNLANDQQQQGQHKDNHHLKAPGSKPGKRASKRRLRPARNQNLPPVRIKEHRRQSTENCHFEKGRRKSGKQIEQEALERLQKEATALESQQPERGGGQTKTSFAQRLRERLQQVAARSAAAKGAHAKELDQGDDNEDDFAASLVAAMPSIVIEEPAEGVPAAAGAGQEGAPLVSIVEFMKETQDESRPFGAAAPELAATKPRSSSLSSGVSNDSALGLEAPTPRPSATLATSSPAEKFLSGERKQCGQSLSLAESTGNLLAANGGGAGTGTFSAAPSPLPSCPPSPNLNRHCSECIRLRQIARMDELDEAIRAAADHYSQLTSSREPERDFSSIRWRLACWLRQIAPPKYSYSFGEGATRESPGELAELDKEAETMAERKAKRKALHPWAWPAEISSGDSA